MLMCAGLLIVAGAWWWSSRESTSAAEAYAKSEAACRAIEKRLMKAIPVVRSNNGANQITVDVPGSALPFRHYKSAMVTKASRAGCHEGIRLATGG